MIDGAVRLIAPAGSVAAMRACAAELETLVGPAARRFDLLWQGPEAKSAPALDWAWGSVGASTVVAEADAPFVVVLPAGGRLSPFLLAYLEAAIVLLDEAGDGIVACGLSAYRTCGAGGLPFVPLEDGSDSALIAVGWGAGAVFSAESYQSWIAFSAANPRAGPADFVHRENGWVLFPRASMAAGDGEVFAADVQVGPRTWRLKSLVEALAVYDARFEIEARILQRARPELAGLDFVVDLYGEGVVEVDGAKLVLSSRPCSTARVTFGMEYVPLEANVLLNTPGDQLSLAPADAFAPPSRASHLRIARHLTRHVYFGAYFGQTFRDFYRRLLRRG